MGPPISRSTNRRSSAAELEIWFRIVHITPELMGVRPEPKTPRVANLLRQAIVWRALLKSGEVSTQAAIAHREGLTRARVTRILGLLRLAPEIQHYILRCPGRWGARRSANVSSGRSRWSMIRSSNSTPSQTSCRSRTYLHRDGRCSSAFSAEGRRFESCRARHFPREFADCALCLGTRGEGAGKKSDRSPSKIG